MGRGLLPGSLSHISIEAFSGMPEELLDDPDALVAWLHASIDAAYRAKAGKSKKA